MRADPDTPGKWLLVSLFVPMAVDTDDPEQTADDLAAIINANWTPFDIEVGAIPAPQWLTPITLSNLRAAAAGVVTPGEPQ